MRLDFTRHSFFWLISDRYLISISLLTALFNAHQNQAFCQGPVLSAAKERKTEAKRPRTKVSQRHLSAVVPADPLVDLVDDGGHVFQAAHEQLQALRLDPLELQAALPGGTGAALEGCGDERTGRGPSESAVPPHKAARSPGTLGRRSDAPAVASCSVSFSSHRLSRALRLGTAVCCSTASASASDVLFLLMYDSTSSSCRADRRRH